MPIVWRYLLLGYLRVFSLSVCSFIAVLLVSRFKEIARFAALSANLPKTVLFVATQIPLIIPITIPLSALLASLLLFQRLSKSYELTAFRASGISLQNLFSPLLAMSLLLSTLNFVVSANITPYCRRCAKELLYYETSVNPLLLLQRQNLAKMKESFIQMKTEQDGQVARDFILVSHNQSSNRLSLIASRKLTMKNEQLEGKDVAIISHLKGENDSAFDPLIIENEAWMSTDASALSSSLKKHRPKIDPSALEFPMLRIQSNEGGKIGKKAFVEMLRRMSLSLSVFSFTLLGCSFGIEQGRNPSKKNLFKALGFTLILMLSYLLGKEFKGNPLLASAILFSPHPIIWMGSFLKIRQVAKGIS